MARRKTAGSTNGRGRRERLSSVATAIRLLKAFSENEVEIGISALARRLGLAKSTVHRLAVTLVSEGLLEQIGRAASTSSGSRSSGSARWCAGA